MAQTLHFVGITWELEQEYKVALESFKDALKLRELAGNAIEIANSKKKIANIFFQMGDWESAKEFAQQSVDLLENANQPYNFADALLLLGKIYELKDDPKTANFYYNLALEKIPNPEGVHYYPILLESQGKVLTRLGKYPESNILLQRAFKIRESQHDVPKLIEILMNTVKNWQELEDFTKCKSFYEEGLRLIGKPSPTNIELRFQIFSSYTEVLYYFGQIPQAIEMAEQSIELAETEQSRTIITLKDEYIIKNLLIIAKCITTSPTPSQPIQAALQYIDEVIERAEKNQLILWKIRGLLQQAQIYHQIREQEKSLAYIIQAHELAMKESRFDIKGEVAKAYGLYYHEQQKHEQAWRYFLEALDHFEHGQNYEEIGECHYNLACLASLQHLGEETLSHLKAAVDINRRYRKWARDEADFKGIQEEALFKQIIE